jgi:predicted hotdog family 3-hydroxylacyl-ACP dehydratase
MNDAAEVESLIPHRLPMRLVERFEPPVEDSIVAFAEVRESWPTVRDGSARTLMLIEVIAQTAAVMQGFRERAQDKPSAFLRCKQPSRASPSGPILFAM